VRKREGGAEEGRWCGRGKVVRKREGGAEEGRWCGRGKVVRKRSGTPPQLHHFVNKDLCYAVASP